MRLRFIVTVAALVVLAAACAGQPVSPDGSTGASSFSSAAEGDSLVRGGIMIGSGT